MDIFLYNTSWIAFNLGLAVLPVLFGMLFFHIRFVLLKFFFGLLWLLFLPNSIYVITDIIHLTRQWIAVDEVGKVILLFQYLVLEIIGLIAFLVSMRYFEMFLKKSVWKKHLTQILIIFNFLIGFGIVLGRVDRLNSWDVFFAPEKVLQIGLASLTSADHIALTILFGLFANCFYFLFRGLVRNLA